MKYGIRITTVNWACIDGGEDRTGTHAEMCEQIQRWKLEDPSIEGLKYDVIPYTGENGKPPPFPKQQPENSRNSRMKR
jgi:hypothetical protein